MIGLGRLRVGVGAVGLTVAGLCWMPEGMADSFHLTTGDVVEGEIIQATRNTIIIRSGGSVRPTSLGLIERVVLKLADGSELNGNLVGWKDGVYEIRSADLLMQVKDGKVIDDGAGQIEVAATQSEQQQTTANRGLSRSETAEVSAMQGLPEFTLKSGQVLVGRIIHVTGSIATIRLHDGGVAPTSRAQIERVRFVADDGEIRSGRLIEWSDDLYQLRNGDQNVSASLGQAAIDAGPSKALVQTRSIAAGIEDQQTDTVIESTDAAAAPETEADDPGLDANKPPEAAASGGDATGGNVSGSADATGAGGPVSETDVASLQQSDAATTDSVETAVVSEGVQGPYLVEPKVADVGEDGREVVFEFRLKQPTDRPLVFLYAATDDTAKAGQDFEAKSGVVTFSAGSEYAEVRVPIIDDEQSESSEQFHLFLSGDPETIQFSQRQIVATINDND